MFLDFEPLFQLVEGFPQAQSDPDYLRVKPYLDHLSYLALGGRSDQDRSTLRMILGLRDSPAEEADDSGAASSAVIAR
jgi:hypothetical protein